MAKTTKQKTDEATETEAQTGTDAATTEQAGTDAASSETTGTDAATTDPAGADTDDEQANDQANEQAGEQPIDADDAASYLAEKARIERLAEEITARSRGDLTDLLHRLETEEGLVMDSENGRVKLKLAGGEAQGAHPREALVNWSNAARRALNRARKMPVPDAPTETEEA